MAKDERRENASSEGGDTRARLDRIQGKGFDSGAGYGGAGNDSEFRASRRQEPAAPNESGVGDGGSAFDGQEGEFDRDSPLGGERREPGR